MIVKFVNTSHHPLPKYETEQSAGMDLSGHGDISPGASKGKSGAGGAQRKNLHACHVQNMESLFGSVASFVVFAALSVGPLSAVVDASDSGSVDSYLSDEKECVKQAGMVNVLHPCRGCDYIFIYYI